MDDIDFSEYIDDDSLDLDLDLDLNIGDGDGDLNATFLPVPKITLPPYVQKKGKCDLEAVPAACAMAALHSDDFGTQIATHTFKTLQASRPSLLP
jgi:hypothetical protein